MQGATYVMSVSRAGSGGSASRTAAETLKAALIGHFSHRLVLLGAGASVDAGMPDGAALAAALVATGRVPAMQLVLDRLTSEQGYPDVERAFSVLSAIADLATPGSPSSDMQKAGLLRPKLPVDPSTASAELEVVAKELRRRLWLVDGLGTGVVEKLLGKPYEAPEEAGYLTPLITASLGGTIATLNYDNVVEKSGGLAVLTRDPSSRRIIVPDESVDKVRLLKLHGSLDWKRVGDDVIHGGRPLEAQHYEPAVIFGAANKLRHYGPFLDLLRAFATKLREVHFVIVIGYGFRDPHINELLRIWATTPAPDSRPKTMIVCQGPAVDRLPPLVEPWGVQDHLRVELMQMPASEVVATLFQ